MRNTSKLFVVLLAFLAFVPCFSQAQEAAPNAATGPTPYPDPNNDAAWPGKGPMRTGSWMMSDRKAAWSKREANQGAIVFVGDSLIGGYKVDKAFPNFKVANCGVGGEVTRGLLFRLKEDIIDLHPQAVVICSGSNDLSCRTDPALAVGNLALVIEQLRASNDKLPIILCLVTPRDVAKAPITEGSLQQLNEGIKHLADGKEGIVVVDVFTPLATPEGKPIPEFFREDKIHPVTAGYEKWTELLTPVFTQLGLK